MVDVKVSSPDKLLFPADGITKAQVVDHYQSVAERMVPLLAGRPLTIQRFPSGIESKGFMQKNAADYFPDTIRRLAVPKRGGGDTRYPVIDRTDDLLYLANQNTITFHMWTSSADEPARPDWLVIDLDPEAGDVGGVRAATAVVRDVLDSFGLQGTPVATGSKGFHVWTRLDGSQGFDRVSLAARALAGLACAREPDALTTEFLKKNRAGRVFVDWLRAAPTATVVVPFSLRPRPGAPAAVPLRWEELDDADPDGWGLGRLDDRLAVALDGEAQTLPVDEIEAAARAAGVDLDTPHDRFGRRRSG
ncbi:MAG: non-homologous end-joining DNA ligase [Actinomycetota bacterium]